MKKIRTVKQNPAWWVGGRHLMYEQQATHAKYADEDCGFRCSI